METRLIIFRLFSKVVDVLLLIFKTNMIEKIIFF